MDNYKNTLRIARGYRLKVSTHNMIKSLQQITRSDSDTVISEACRLFYKKILDQNTTDAQIDDLDGTNKTGRDRSNIYNL